MGNTIPSSQGRHPITVRVSSLRIDYDNQMRKVYIITLLALRIFQHFICNRIVTPSVIVNKLVSSDNSMLAARMDVFPGNVTLCPVRSSRVRVPEAGLMGEMLGNPAAICSIRLCSISGFDRRINDVVYCFPLIRSDEVSTVVFFGGDVQDFPENMETHRDNKNYVKWNLENTATLLHTYFPESHIVVVRPSRMEMKTFSCYDNFVPCNNSGAPNHTPMHHALQHLEQLLRGVSQRLQAMPASELARSMSSIPEELQASQDAGEETQMWWQKDLCLEKSKLILIGFSKGCVVLNQFIYEFHYLKTLTPDDESMANLVDQIQDMYWLDGGHAGGKNTWITSRSLLETLTRLNIGIHIHVTPYQINDDRRPWIRKEEKAFGDLLRRLGAPVHRVVHFENQVSSLCTHFEVLSVFHQAEAK